MEIKPISRVVVNASALETNYRHLDRITGPVTEIAAVVKADGYGHGIIGASEAFYRAGCRTFCIVSTQEAALLRERFGSEIRILKLIPSLPEELEAVAALEVEESLVSWDQATMWEEWLKPHGKRLKIHIKIDRGMGRLGFGYLELMREFHRLEHSPCLIPVALMSHLPASEEEPRDPDGEREDEEGYTTAGEIRRFRQIVEEMADGFEPPLQRHTGNSGTALFYEEGRFDLLRVGLALYGADPRIHDGRAHGLIPAMRYETRLVQVRDFPAGATIGYGRQYKVAEPMRVGVLPVGYSDGLLRSIAAHGEVLVHGIRCKILGRISMNLTSVDIRDVPEARVGDAATILGEDGDDCITVEELARWWGTIPYEVFTTLGRLIPRFVISGE